MTPQDIANFLIPDVKTAFTVASTAGLTALGFYLSGNADNWFTSPIKNAALRAGGFTLAASNSSAISDHQDPYHAVIDAFNANADLNYIFIELADRAIIAKRGDEVKILDFTKPKAEMTDAVVYSQMKDMFGHKSPEEIYKFAKNGLGYDLSEIYDEEKSGLNAIDAERVIEHAAMNCSWARKLKNYRSARLQIADAFLGMLKTLSIPKDAPIKGPDNISEKGTYAFRWTQEPEEEDGEKQTAILIKPRTDTEKEIHMELFKTRRSDIDKHGKAVTGNQALENYARVKDVKRERDRSEVRHQKYLRENSFVSAVRQMARLKPAV